MKVIKSENQFGPIIIFDEESKFLRFTFGGNGDLYISFYSKKGNAETSFSITKENYGAYILFEQLFYDIENINIFDENYIPFYIETEEEKLEYLKRRKEEIEFEKKRYRMFNRSNYNELYDDDNKMITWYSDETAHEVANILKIKKNNDEYILQFFIQPHIDGYDEDFHTSNYIPIRIRNSGSSYDPFNITFMKMYNKMKELDDVRDIGYQIHIEEYIYSKEKKLIKER